MPTEAEKDKCQRLWDSAVYLTRTDYVLKSYELATRYPCAGTSPTGGSRRCRGRTDCSTSNQQSTEGPTSFSTVRDPAGSIQAGAEESVGGEEYGALMSAVERHQQLAGQHSKGTTPDPLDKLNGASGGGTRDAPAGASWAGAGAGSGQEGGGPGVCDGGPAVQRRGVPEGGQRPSTASA